MEMEMEDDSLIDDVMFCLRCCLTLYPTNDDKKYFLMSCRLCKYGHQLDYEFSGKKHVNEKPKLAPVRKQGAEKERVCAKSLRCLSRL